MCATRFPLSFTHIHRKNQLVCDVCRVSGGQVQLLLLSKCVLTTIRACVCLVRLMLTWTSGKRYKNTRHSHFHSCRTITETSVSLSCRQYGAVNRSTTPFFISPPTLRHQFSSSRCNHPMFAPRRRVVDSTRWNSRVSLAAVMLSNGSTSMLGAIEPQCTFFYVYRYVYRN